MAADSCRETNGLCVVLCVGCVLQTLNYSKHTGREVEVSVKKKKKVLLKPLLNQKEFSCTVICTDFDVSTRIFFNDQCEMQPS